MLLSHSYWWNQYTYTQASNTVKFVWQAFLSLNISILNPINPSGFIKKKYYWVIWIKPNEMTSKFQWKCMAIKKQRILHFSNEFLFVFTAFLLMTQKLNYWIKIKNIRRTPPINTIFLFLLYLFGSYHCLWSHKDESH